MRVYSPRIPEGSADFTLVTPMYFNSLFQSHLSGENAAQFLQLKPFTQYQFSFHLQGGQSRCGFKACQRLLHMTSVAGIEPQTTWSRVQCLNHSVTRSTRPHYIMTFQHWEYSIEPDYQHLEIMIKGWGRKCITISRFTNITDRVFL